MKDSQRHAELLLELGDKIAAPIFLVVFGVAFIYIMVMLLVSPTPLLWGILIGLAFPYVRHVMALIIATAVLLWLWVWASVKTKKEE